MITVQILINGEVIYARTAVNVKDIDLNDTCEYKVDDGSKIIHNRKDGAVKLSKKILDTIKEV